MAKKYYCNEFSNEIHFGEEEMKTREDKRMDQTWSFIPKLIFLDV